MPKLWMQPKAMTEELERQLCWSTRMGRWRHSSNQLVPSYYWFPQKMIQIPRKKTVEARIQRFLKNQLENHLAHKELGIGEQTRREIGKFSEEKQRKFVLGARSFLIAATKHLVSKLPLDNIILRSSKVLKSDAGSEDWSLKAIKILAKKLKVSVDLVWWVDNLSARNHNRRVV